MEDHKPGEHKQHGNGNSYRAESSCPLFVGHTEIGMKIEQFFDGIPFSIVITLVTVITLFSDDVRQILFEPDSDLAFSILTLVCMGFYTVEMVALSLTKEGYFLKFYFWLDLVSTLTMLLDLTWITQLINGGQGGIEAATSIAKIARASRASKIGAKSTKLIRMLRLIRLIRLYKTASNRLNKETQQKMKDTKDNNEHKEIALRKKINQADGRKGSKRLERIQQAATAWGIPNQHKITNTSNHDLNKPQVSLGDIAFQGSNRKLSVLHPSRNNTMQARHPSAMVKNDAEFIGSGLRITSSNKFEVSDKGKPANENFMSVEQIQSRQAVQDHQSNTELSFPSETKVGNKLNDEIQKNIISMILLILISIPLLSGDTWFDTITNYEKGIEEMSYFAHNFPALYDIEAEIFIEEMLGQPEPVIFFDVKVNSTCCQFPRDYPQYEDIASLESLRTDQISIYLSSAEDTIIFDISQTNILSAQLNVGRTLFVCALLIIATLLFSRDLEMHALEPLQNMIETVKRISSHPLEAVKYIEKQLVVKQSLKKDSQRNEVSEEDLLLIEEHNTSQTEPTILENMIIKISSLLAVGFGEAGTDLIAKNIENCGKLNVMIPGKKVMGIFGFCDIRNFTDATEVLEANVMVFVNEIAEICHKVVNRVGGNPNKNIGDAFLLVWKFQDDDTVNVQNRHEMSLELRSSLKVRQTADLAVYSFVKMVAQITRSRELSKYRENKGLKDRIKDYKGVKMGFGLHVGWAIEGPIGSEFKIDASYLGPHVNMSSRLEAATKEYGTMILITECLYSLMTPKNKQNLRQIDRVEIKAGEKPMDLFTVDLCPENLLRMKGLYNPSDKTSFEKKKAKVYHNYERDLLMEQILKKRVTSNIWKDDQDIATMRQPFTQFFFEEWKKGFEAYQKGDWKLAAQILEKTKILGVNNYDGPSDNLLRFMKQTEMEPPEDWKGVKEFCG